MRGATLFSGIGAPECSAPDIHWLWAAEIEKFPSAVLAVRFPETANLGDVTADDFCERAERIGRPDILVFGSPCQSFSVAGKRLGLDDPRGNLAIVALGIARRLRVRWLVFENVPGLLSSFSGAEQAECEVREGDVGGAGEGVEDRDFAAFLSVAREFGYLGCWRSPDAQYAGLAQRRERVFAVLYLGDWRPPAAVLFEPESMSGNPAPSRETRQDIAPTISARPTGGGGLGTDFDLDGGLISSTGSVAHCLNAGGMGRIDYESETMVAHNIAPPIRAGGHDASHANAGVMPAVAFDMRGREGGAMPEGPHDTANLRAASGGSSRSYVAEQWAVRRLTPLECERLQGFSDNFTNVTYRGKPAADGPRYRALGNAMAVPVIGWILRRIVEVNSILEEA